ncbi:hypothetical protein AMTRI_Chr02g220840 [Amborella trichopoda]
MEQLMFSEKVNINFTQNCIVLEGKGRTRTIISWKDSLDTLSDDFSNDGGTAGTATFTSGADDFVARKIAFVNAYDIKKGMKRAVAALLYGDRYAFYECGFSSGQDTLADFRGRHYFSQCYIEGAIDFIFGGARSLYENCILQVNARPNQVINGAITANGRESDGDPSGYVFKYCEVFGTGRVYLGRAWRAFSRVIYSHCNMTDVVADVGWNSWKNSERNIFYGEYNNVGAGADMSKRVPWVVHLSGVQDAQFTGIKFIDTDGWIGRQPY